MYSRTLYIILRQLFGYKTATKHLEDVCKQLTKIPNHISFLMLENSVSDESLAKLVVWSLIVGIKNISLYDHKGRIKQNQDTLLLHLHNQIKKLKIDKQIIVNWRPNLTLNSNYHQTVIVTCKGGTVFPDINGNAEHKDNKKELNSADGLLVNGNLKNGRKNGSSNGRANGFSNGHYGSNGSVHVESNGFVEGNVAKRINITLLSSQDGKPKIARCAQDICDYMKHSSNQEITETFINQRLNDGSADPCLLIRLGSLKSNADYCPWDVRLSEMHNIDTIAGVYVQQFSDVLKQYSKCDQRFGK